MIDETAGPGSAGVGNPAGGPGEQGTAAERVGFCQECGRVVTTETVRRVGPAIYCELCQNARASAGAWQAVPPAGAPYGSAGSASGPGYANAYAPGTQGTGPATSSAGMPHPFLAALLGFIPGVGAMYNGQYAKGFAHLLIFAVFVSLSDHVHGIFGLLVAGWVFYQVFDAYATARARIAGQPLPNPFGLNEIGERIGLTPTAPRNTAEPDAPPPFSGWTSAAAPPPVHPPEPPPPTSYAAASDTASMGATSATSGSGWHAAPYRPTFTGAFPDETPYTATAIPASPPSTPASRFPTAAVFLVGMGLLLLLGNLLPQWHFEGRWLAPFFLAGLSVWMLLHRLQTLPSAGFETNASGMTVAGIPLSGRFISSLRAPAMLFAIAVLLSLQSAGWVGLSHTWPVLCILWGGLMLLERTAGSRGTLN